MLLVLFLVLIALLPFITALWMDEYGVKFAVAIISGVMTVICLIATIVLSLGAIFGHITARGQIAENEQRYDSLVYQLENNLYDNDNDLGKKELYNQIQSWNEDLAYYKAVQRDFWLGFLYPNIYDEFKFIELK